MLQSLLSITHLVLRAYADNYAIPGNIAPSGSLADPAGLLVNFYQFGMLLAGVLAFGMVVWAGVQYSLSRGNPTGQADARDRVIQAFLGILLLVGAYAILYTLNPGLTRLQLPTLSPIDQSLLAGQQPGGYEGDVVLPEFSAPVGGNHASLPPGGGKRCEPPTRSDNYCNVDILRQHGCKFADDTAAYQFSATCKAESGGNNPNIPSVVDVCKPSGPSVSYGIFQINLSSHKLNGIDCTEGLKPPYTSKNHSCHIANQSIFDQCKNLATDVDFNLRYGCELYNTPGVGLKPWGAAYDCGFIHR